MATPRSAKVGAEVEQMCGRCKELRYHTISAMGTDGRIEQVVCNFCHASHRYSGPKPASASTRTRAAAAPRASRARAADVDDGREARPYAATDVYEKGEVVQHPKYGRGRVADVRNDRIDVRFSDGAVRVFVHAMKRPPAAS